MSAVDWNDIGNLEFCEGSGWENSGKIVGAFPSEDGILVVVRRPAGLHVHFVVNAEGRIYDGTRVIRTATLPHRLEVVEGPVWTLFITGRRVREWGFHCPKGWVPWKQFVAPHDSGQIGRGCCE